MALALLAITAVISIAMLALKPFPQGQNWHSAPIITAVVIAIWLAYRWRPSWFANNPWVLGFILIAGLVVAVAQISALEPNSEVTRVYRAVFRTLDLGANPYDCNCIPHDVDGAGWRLGNFNYPPAEIWPYYLVYKALGTWNLVVFTSVLVALGLGTCAVLRFTFPNVPIAVLACYFPLLVFLGIETNSATTLVMVALAALFIRRSLSAVRARNEVLLAVVFGVGLLTKFVLIPIFAAFYWGRVRLGDLRSLVRPALGALAVVAIALVQMAPFGVVNVIRETVQFNLALETRASLATYYPNVVSGLFYWLSIEWLFPVAAVAILAISVMVAPALRTFSAILLAVTTFMFVATTPEPQYLSIVLYIALVGSLSARFSDREPEPEIDLRGAEQTIDRSLPIA